MSRLARVVGRVQDQNGTIRRARAFSDTISMKHLFQSKTIWANSVALGIALWQYYVAPIASADPQLFALAVAVINIGLRFRTSQAITL